jgi:DNA replication protein DnaC
MILSGKPGTGKTHLAIAIARAVVAGGATARYSTVGDAMRFIRASYDDDAKRSEGQAIDAFVAPDLLVLDEVGASGGSEHEHRMFFEIINKRYEQARCTLLVSNLMGDELRSFLGDRVLDRMRDGAGKLLTFDWPSYRK